MRLITFCVQIIFLSGSLFSFVSSLDGATLDNFLLMATVVNENNYAITPEVIHCDSGDGSCGEVTFGVACNSSTITDLSDVYIMVTMGNYKDYFRPAETSTSMCEMLTSNNLHQHSYDLLTWTTPEYDESSLWLGGGTPYGENDSRSTLPYWGTQDGSEHSGYGHSTDGDTAEWNQSYTIHYFDTPGL